MAQRQRYNFSVDPTAMMAAAQAHSADAQARGAGVASGNQALGQIYSTLYQQPANFAGAFSNTYGHQAGALGNMANAAANERSNLYGANAMAEAARMGALGNIGSAGLGAAGSASNAAMDAWARNQQAYNQSLAGMQMANQNTLGTLGASRNQALGGLGGAIAATGMMGGGPMGGQFAAGGVGGPVADGSFSGGGGAGGGAAALTGLGDLQNNLMSPDILNAAMQGNDAGMNRLDQQHYSSRDMPSNMLGQSLSGLMTMTDMNSRNIGAGMDQFYGNQQRAGDQAMGALGGMLGSLNDGFNVTNQNIQGMWDNSLGRTAFQPQADRLADARAARIDSLQRTIAANPNRTRRAQQELRALQGLA
jgi:hypothetical protein